MTQPPIPRLLLHTAPLLPKLTMHMSLPRVDLVSPTPDQVPLIRGYLEQLARDEGVPQARATDDFLRQTLFSATPAAVAHLVQLRHAGDATANHCGLTVHSWKWGAFSGVLDMYVHVLVIDPALRGRGVGKAVVAVLHDVARARGASRLELLTTAGNASAAAFYDRQGLLEAAHMVVRRKPCGDGAGRP